MQGIQLRLAGFGLLQGRVPLRRQTVVLPHQLLIAVFPIRRLSLQQLVLPCEGGFGLGTFVHGLSHGGVGLVNGGFRVGQLLFQLLLPGGQLLRPAFKELLFPFRLLQLHLLFAKLLLHPTQLGRGLRMLGYDIAGNHQKQRQNDGHDGHSLFHAFPPPFRRRKNAVPLR